MIPGEERVDCESSSIPPLILYLFTFGFPALFGGLGGAAGLATLGPGFMPSSSRIFCFLGRRAIFYSSPSSSGLLPPGLFGGAGGGLGRELGRGLKVSEANG